MNRILTKLVGAVTFVLLVLGWVWAEQYFSLPWYVVHPLAFISGIGWSVMWNFIGVRRK